jgi:hypothetical protein
MYGKLFSKIPVVISFRKRDDDANPKALRFEILKEMQVIMIQKMKLIRDKKKQGILWDLSHIYKTKREQNAAKDPPIFATVLLFCKFKKGQITPFSNLTKFFK